MIKTAEERIAVEGAYNHSDRVLNTVTVSFAKYHAMIEEAEELRAALKPQAQQSQWISVEERLPEKFVDVLVYPRPTDYCCEAALHEDAWYWAEYESNFGEKRVKCKVTHWMPLPPAPEGGE